MFRPTLLAAALAVALVSFAPHAHASADAASTTVAMMKIGAVRCLARQIARAGLGERG